jgi:hypothetical protein
MSHPTVAMVLAPITHEALSAVPHGSPAWIASTPEMRNTVRAATAIGLVVTELVTNGDASREWLFNHLDSVDQHHNEFSQQPPYSELLVFGVASSAEIESWLQQFGFCEVQSEPFGFSARKQTSSASKEVEA